jgi:hypothetical protein
MSDANRAAFLLQEMLGVDGDEGLIRLVWAEALHGRGRTSEAQRAIRLAAMRIRERASRIGDERLRHGFLEEVAEHRRTLSLEKLWRADAEPS